MIFNAFYLSTALHYTYIKYLPHYRYRYSDNVTIRWRGGDGGGLVLVIQSCGSDANVAQRLHTRYI